MLRTLAGLFYHLPRGVQNPLQRTWYQIMSSLDRDADMIFMNYGWASLDPADQKRPLWPEDEANRYCAQLYHRVAGAVDLGGLDALEVGCGRGGGASYVMRYLQPRSLVGLDRTPASIAFCRRQYAIPGLTFVRGRAEALQFSAETYDVVINVESSHCYSSMLRFLRGVYRVLRPGGYFLFADHRSRDDAVTLRQQLTAAGLALLEEEDITANVIRALELDNARKLALIDRKVPMILRPMFHEFAGVQGTPSIYARMSTGDVVYLRFTLQK